MANGNWKKLIKDLNESVSERGDKSLSGLIDGERHQEIVRKKLLGVFSAAAIPSLSKSEVALRNLGKEIDSVTDAIVQNASKDGLDIDSEVLDRLLLVSANVYAIQVKQKEIYNLLNQK